MLVAFVALAAAISYNAVYLQKGPHPAPMAADGQIPQAGQDKGVRQRREITKILPRNAMTTASLPRSKATSAIQRKLAEIGYEPGPLDGVLGNMTRAAIMAYQYDNGLRVTGVASETLLRNMIFGVSGVNADSDNTPVPDETKTLVRTVQKTLTKLGYDSGPEDGLWGTATRKAIEQFERDHKLTVKGRISGQFLKALMQANGGDLSKIVSS